MATINKQTLFFYSRYGLTVTLFDIKTLSTIQCKDKQAAIDFCRQQNELKCIEDINTDISNHECVIYLNTKKDSHRVIDMQNGKIVSITSRNLIAGTRKGKVLNLEMTDSDKIRINWVVEQTPKGFEAEIKKQYQQFQASMLLLNGSKQEFKYVIIGKYVILTEVPKEYVKVVVPSFVTSIARYALYSQVTHIRISDGVRFMGRNAIPLYKGVTIEGGHNIKYIVLYESIYTWEKFKGICSNYNVNVPSEKYKII